MADGNKSFILYTSYKAPLSLLSDEDKGRLFMGLFEYIETGMVPELPAAPLIAFSFIRDDMDRNKVKYEERAERSRTNGASGGRPRKDTYENNEKETQQDKEETQKTQQVFQEPKKPDNVYVYDNDYDNDLKNNDAPARVPACVDPFKSFAKSETMAKALKEFAEMRSKMRKPLTAKAKDMAIKQLCKLSDDEQTQVKIIEQSIYRGWQSFYELKDDGGSRSSDIDLEKLFEAAAKKGLEGSSGKGG